MLLLDVKKKDNWLLFDFLLTYEVGWDKLCKAVYMAYNQYEDPEVLIDGKKVNIAKHLDIIELEEAEDICLRGISEVLEVPIMITFYNKHPLVTASVPCITEEFMEADYRKCNHAIGKYMDSMELVMYM